MINNVLVALDTREPCTHVFTQAIELAKATGAELKMLSVLSTVYDSTAYYPAEASYNITMSNTFWDRYETELKEEKERVSRLLSTLKEQAQAQNVQTAVVQASGDPGVVICDRANSEQTDLVIVGSHGRRGLDEWLVGSVSSYVMHRATCSVMVVHKREEPTQTAHLETAIANAT